MFEKVREWLEQGALIIDVRTPEEFQEGANPRSVNIPLDQFEGKIASLDKSKTILLCCASGIRSGAACSMLTTRGFRAYNVGAWENTLV